MPKRTTRSRAYIGHAADEIERLRALVHPFEGAIAKVEEQGKEIERLRAEKDNIDVRATEMCCEIERLRKALHWMAQNCLDPACVRRAIDILKPEKESLMDIDNDRAH